MVRINAVSTVAPPHAVGIEDFERVLARYMTDAVRARLQRTLRASRNRTRHAVLPLEALVRLGGAGERGALYREHATRLAERAVSALVDGQRLDAAAVTSLVFVSSTGWAAPSIDTHLVRRFGLDPRCRRVPLTQLGCAGGVAALNLASEMVRRDAAQRVLVVAAELPSLQLQLAEPSYPELLAASQFGDGAAAAIVSSDGHGLQILATESVLLPETEEGGRILPCESGLRLVASAGLPDLVRARVHELLGRFAAAHDVDVQALSFVLAHPRGPAVLDAVAEGLQLDATALAASWAAWEGAGNTISASVFRALAELVRAETARAGDVGAAVAFGTGVACEMTLLRWGSTPPAVIA